MIESPFYNEIYDLTEMKFIYMMPLYMALDIIIAILWMKFWHKELVELEYKRLLRLENQWQINRVMDSS